LRRLSSGALSGTLMTESIIPTVVTRADFRGRCAPRVTEYVGNVHKNAGTARVPVDTIGADIRMSNPCHHERAGPKSM
jgi:hypothetical protein